MVGFRPAWFVHVDPDANFPRYVKTTDLAARTGVYLGPLEDKHAAARLIQLAEDAFDLCRYYNILVESPHAKACAYKEMGKCPAPCDGSISMDAVPPARRAGACETLVDPAEFVREQEPPDAAGGGRAAVRDGGEDQAVRRSVDAARQGLASGTSGRWRTSRSLSLQRGPRAGRRRCFSSRPGGSRRSPG